MKRVFVDANVFLRFFTRDDKGQHERAVKLFEQASNGKIVLVSGPPVLFEISWTLKAAYKQSLETILEVLSSLLALEGLELLDAKVVELALFKSKKTGVDFADAYIAASAELSNVDTIASFNQKDFQKLDAILWEM